MAGCSFTPLLTKASSSVRCTPGPQHLNGVQGHESVVVERHMGKAVRVSVAVVQGEQGPIALVPSQEEVICPEAVFLDAGLASEREAARREVLAHTCMLL